MTLAPLLLKSTSELPHTSTRTKNLLKSLGINSYQDLIFYLPFRYETTPIPKDIATHYQTFAEVTEVFFDPNEDNSLGTVRGMITKIAPRKSKRGLLIIDVYLKDESEKEAIATWFNQKYLLRILRIGQYIQVVGKLSKIGSRLGILVKSHQLDIDVNQHITSDILHPIYPETSGISSKTIHEKIKLVFDDCIQEIKDHLPNDFLKEKGFVSLTLALKSIHFPTSMGQAQSAQVRLTYDEGFKFMLKNHFVKERWKSIGLIEKLTDKSKEVFDTFVPSLPFTLTSSQEKVTAEIFSDLKKASPMNRLLQGDVGTGKTVVAMSAAYFVFLNRKKTLIMAPTSILANQHFLSITKLFANIKNSPIPKVKLLTRENTKKDSFDDADIIIGTHALLFSKENFLDVGLIIIDEQHKFGVTHRAKLVQKAHLPHTLSMSATPIPRSLALTMFGHLDISVIDHPPENRQKIKTYLVPFSKREDSFNWILDQIHKTQCQVFWVFPFIDPSKSETLATVKSATEEFKFLQNKFPKKRLALLHGKMKSKEKDLIMNDFLAKNYDILVSTPVVEVGVDIPNATIIVIEGAERFGMASLHQLRGRVGRGEMSSFCLLFTSSGDIKNNSRLKLFAATQDGFELSKYDLMNRGSGDVFGMMQTGELNFRYFDPLSEKLVNEINTDLALLSKRKDWPEISSAFKSNIDTYHDIAKN